MPLGEQGLQVCSCNVGGVVDEGPLRWRSAHRGIGDPCRHRSCVSAGVALLKRRDQSPRSSRRMSHYEVPRKRLVQAQVKSPYARLCQSWVPWRDQACKWPVGRGCLTAPAGWRAGSPDAGVAVTATACGQSNNPGRAAKAYGNTSSMPEAVASGNTVSGNQ